MKKFSLLVACLFVVAFGINAQTDFRAGYIVKTSGDTLLGEVDYRSNQRMNRVCTFRPTCDSKSIQYNATQLLAYGFRGGKIYETKEVNSSSVFLECLINGCMKIYYLSDGKSNCYYFEKPGVPLTALPYTEEIQWREDSYYMVESTKHIGVLTYHLQDAPALRSEIASIKEPGHENLIQLARHYNKLVCSQQKTTYENKMPALRINPEIAAGAFIFLEPGLRKAQCVRMGVYTHVSAPQISEKIYFKTGLLLTPHRAGQDNFMQYDIPLQIEYIYPTGIIRPKFSIGTNLFTDSSLPKILFFFSNLQLSCGVNVKLNKSIYWSLNADAFVQQLEGLRFAIPASSFSTGIYFKF
ncbi:MAG TPA: hypothetical protein VK152_05650 [Paludibacter sp.]|nr:hypothetical protein [Paludibacter sp.]